MQDNYTPKINGLYRHLKGGIYQVICLAMDTEDACQLCVVYKSLQDGETYVRPLHMWSETVGDVLRFEYLGLVAKEETE